MRALIIDDSRTMRSILRRILEELDIEVYEAGDGQQGLECLEKNSGITIALVDWNVPVMNGLEFVSTIKASNKYPELKIMMVTTETEAIQVQKAIEAGADEYAMKPFTKQVIIEKLRILGVHS